MILTFIELFPNTYSMVNNNNNTDDSQSSDSSIFVPTRSSTPLQNQTNSSVSSSGNLSLYALSDRYVKYKICIAGGQWKKIWNNKLKELKMFLCELSDFTYFRYWFTTCKTTGYKFFLKKYSFNKISAIIRDGKGRHLFLIEFWLLIIASTYLAMFVNLMWAPICFHFFPLYPHSRLQWLQNFNVRPYWTGIARNLNLLCLCIYINLK